MRITAIIILACCLTASGKGLTQSVSISVKNAPLEKVFAEIKRQTGYSIFYNYRLIEKAKPVTLNFKNASVEKVVKACLKDQGLDFEIADKSIVIKEVNPTMQGGRSADNSLLSPPPITIRVVDSSGTPLTGASISLRNSKVSAIAGNEGALNLNLTEGDIIVVSYVGYETISVKVTSSMLSSSNDLVITLTRSVARHMEISVISTGYEKTPKERATGSFAHVNNDLFNKRVSTDVLSRLEGNVPGLIFNKNNVNAALGATDLSIRGHSTLFSNDQPLIVLDNFAYDGDINNINPNDVESVTVLKDAAAASIWGVRSGNGVIVITTKKGERNHKLATDINANVTIGTKPDLFYSRNFLRSSDYIEVEKNLFNQGYYDSQLSDPTALVSPIVQILSNERSGLLSHADALNKIEALKSADIRNDLKKYLYRKTMLQQYSMGLRGGGENNDYSVSIGYDKSLLSLKGNRNDRITLNSMLNFYMTKNLTLTTGINYVETTILNNALGSQYIPNFPYLQLGDKDGNALVTSNDYSINYKDSMTNLGFLDWQLKPLEEMGLADNKSKEIYNRINVGAKYNFFKSLNANLKYQYERSTTNNVSYFSESTYYTRNLINLYSQRDANNVFSYPIPIGGILQSTNGSFTSHQVRGQLNYNNIWANKHELTGIIGSEIRQSINQFNSNVAYGYDKKTGNSSSLIDFRGTYPQNPFGSGRIPNTLSFSKTTNNFISYYSNLAYSYLSRYTLSLSGRIDHSNLFGVKTNHKAVPLFSTGLSWIVNREPFYHVDWLPNLTVKATYGYNANINTGATAITTIRRFSNSGYNGLNYAIIMNPGNPQLQWEKVRIANVGIDYTALHNRLTGSVEYYHKWGLNLFGSSELPPSTGVTSFFGNTANTEGHGIDLVVNSKNINSKNFKWLTNALLSQAVDKVTKYDLKAQSDNYLNYGSGNSGAIVPRVGFPLFAIYSYRWAGLTHDTGDPQGYVGGKPSVDYSTILQNTTVDSMVYNGPSRPTLFGSLRNTISFKNFSLSFNILYKFNYYFRRASISDVSFIASRQAGNADYYDRWQNPGDELHTNVPAVLYPPFDRNRDVFYRNASVLIEKGDHIRLQDIGLFYDLAQDTWRSSPFHNVQFYFNINNVGIIWRANNKGIDPDLYSLGGQIPPSKTFSVGMRANF